MNKNLFKSVGTTVAPANAVNEAGGKAYSLTDEGALAQYVVTGCFNQTYYASAEDQLEKIKELAGKCSSEFIAKCAVYGHETAKMKDTPAYLLALLAARGEIGLVSSCFNRVITNGKMLCNFVQMVRSGVTGRKSFGSAIKKLILNWINSKEPFELYRLSVGQSNPSVADVIKMVHPRPKNAEYDSVFAYLIGRQFADTQLPEKLRQLEAFKKDSTLPVPQVDFRVLSNIKMSTEQWSDIAKNMSWNTLRMNLNTLKRNNVLEDKAMVQYIADQLRDPVKVQKSSVFPYQLLTTFQNADVPTEISNALQDAMELATKNVPNFGNGGVVVCPDISGSMDSPVTGYNGTATTKTTCRDVSALISSVVLRNNENASVLPFHTQVQTVKLNPRDSVMTNSGILRRLPSGGTDCSSPIRHLNAQKATEKLVIVVSDNMSWVDYAGWYGRKNDGTDMALAWKDYKKRVHDAKLVLIDIQPGSTTQVGDNKDILNIGGWSDSVFEVISRFANGENNTFANVINQVTL